MGLSTDSSNTSLLSAFSLQKGSSTRYSKESARNLLHQLTLALYSDRVLRLAYQAVAVFIILFSVLMLMLYASHWLRVSAETEDMLSDMRNATLQKTPAELNLERIGLSEDERTRIVERNLFNTRVVPPPPVATNDSENTPQRVNTDFALLGTFYSGLRSEAIIENKKTKAQDAFRLGERIFDEATLERIFADRVEILRGSELEVLHLDMLASSTASASVADVDESISIDSSDLEEALANLPLLLTQARAVPFFQDGQAVGLRLFAIRDGSLYQKAGLRNGDILKSVNGNSLADISKAAKLFEMLREERSIVLEMERSRAARRVHFSIQ